MEKVFKIILIILVGLPCCYVVILGFAAADVTYKTKVEYPVVKEVARCAIDEYFESEGYHDVAQLTCGVDKMENCLLEVTFEEDPLCYTYRYNCKEKGIEICWITDRTIYPGAPKHLPEYDEAEDRGILYYYGIEDYLADNSFSKWESYIKTKAFENVAERAVQ